MNGKASKALRRMGRADKASKRLFKSLPHTLRGLIRIRSVEAKGDHLREITGR